MESTLFDARRFDVRRLNTELQAWYRKHGRDLPWRRSRDPFAIWVSEAMLQQTRVETVLPYWERFMASFPTAADLARASEDEVLARWSGLGYYRRARALRRAAMALVERHGGEFPRARESVLALPGIGPYTAGAVLSIAFDLPEPLVDGNVARVFARLFELEDELGSSRLQRRLWELAGELVPDQGAGDWNQGLMELGATVCLARSPRCGDCPLSAACRARAAGRAEELPRPKPRRAPVDVELLVLVVRAGETVLLERRPGEGRMAGMWQLPTVERAAGAAALFPESFPAGADLRQGEELGQVRHAITHHRIRARVSAGELGGPAVAPLCWTRAVDLERLPLTGMTRKILRAFPGRGPVKHPGPRR